MKCLKSIYLILFFTHFSINIIAQTNGKTVSVFTSADGTNLRLSKTAEAKFEKIGQPLETQVCIFVNPNKSFQTVLGIGGAITDASAEVGFNRYDPKQ